MTTTPLPYLQLFPAFAGTDNPALTAALHALPDYDAHQAGKQRIAEAVQEANAELLKAARARVALVQQVTATARADKPQPSDLTRQAVKSAQALADARETVALLQEADQTVAVERDQTLSTAPATLMRHLDEQLQEALSEARALRLDDVHRSGSNRSRPGGRLAPVRGSHRHCDSNP